MGILVALIGPIIGAMIGGAALSAGAAEGGEAAAAAMMATAMAAILGAAVVGVLYFAIEAFTGWTLGKLILGLRIRNADGSEASTGTLFKRYAIKNIAFLFSVVALITGMVTIYWLGQVLGIVVFIGMFFVFAEAKQALHDKLAATAVYKKAAAG